MKTFVAVLMLAGGAAAQGLTGTWEATLPEQEAEVRVVFDFGEVLTLTYYTKVPGDEEFGSLDVVIVYEGPWEATGDTLRAQLALKQATFNGMSAEDYVASELAGIDDPDFDLEQVTAELLEGLAGDLPLAEALVARFEIDGDQLTVDPEDDFPLTLTRTTTAVRAVSWGVVKQVGK